MWISSQVIDYLKERQTKSDCDNATFQTLLIEAIKENSKLHAETEALKLQVATTNNHFDWLRQRVNSLEVERAQLIQKAYGFVTPVPEIIRQTPLAPDLAAAISSQLFEHVDDEMANKVGKDLFSIK